MVVVYTRYYGVRWLTELFAYKDAFEFTKGWRWRNNSSIWIVPGTIDYD